MILKEAADSEIDFACPWHHLLPELNTKSRQLTLATTLWEFNRNLSTERTIPLEDFVQKVWGDEEQKTSTVRSAVSRFVAFLKEKGIEFAAKVHDRQPRRKLSIPQKFPTTPQRIELRRPEPDLPTERLAYSYQQAAETLRISVSTVKRRVKDGLLPVVMIGCLPRIPRSVIQRLLDEE